MSDAHSPLTTPGGLALRQKEKRKSPLEAGKRAVKQKPRSAFTGGAHKSCGRDSPAADQDSNRRISICQSFSMQLMALRG
ncbi:hypothetical protein BGLA2_1720079 [Burkholderia gladioli]|nr:hypothetical protein BGLA2_1720079 [Burkholderia gladioli]